MSTVQPITVQVAAAGYAKTDARPQLLSTSYPATCGDDAFFVAQTKQHCAVGVADGVGGWADIGVDPSLFSFSLMINCFHTCELDQNVPAQEAVCLADPRLVVERAYAKLVADKTVVAGSSTACVAVVDLSSATIRVANLGDSGYLLIRDGHLVAGAHHAACICS